jgi:predicted GH43/DUF377 family glycosyl hydrolase
MLLGPEMLEPSAPHLRVVGAFNPAAFRVGDEIHLIVRVAEAAAEERPGYFPSPRLDPDGGAGEVTIDWIRYDPRPGEDTRILVLPDGRVRLRFISHLRRVRLAGDGLSVVDIEQGPWMYPGEPYEEFGVEDPRISVVDGRVLLAYVACSRAMGIATALAEVPSTGRRPKRLGVAFPTENKDVVLFDRKIRGSYVALHRPVSRHQFAGPSIWIARSDDLEHWGHHKVVFTPRPDNWDAERIGAGPPPVKVKGGWLFIYHGVTPVAGDAIGVYAVGAALLAARDPSQVVARSAGPILVPEGAGEREGFTPNVVFPTAADLRGDRLTLYAGAADTRVVAIVVSLDEVMGSLEEV